MNKEIKYSGYSAVPSDYECNDGELAASFNLIREEGPLKMLPQPDVRFSIGTNLRLFIHRIGSIYNYISYSPLASSLDWIGTEPDGEFETAIPIALPDNIGTIINISSVGYIIIVSTTQNLYYIRFNTKKNAYVFLGSKIPDILLELGLKLNFTVSDTQEKTFEVVSNESGNSGNTTTGENDWQTVIATSYYVTYANGLLKREWVTSEKLRDSYVATQFTPFDTAFKILANVEYRFKWDVVSGCHWGMTIAIWGNRNGSSEREMFFGTANEDAMPNSIEIRKTFADEWTNIGYIIQFRYPDTSSANCGTKGNITWYKGIDNSESGSEDVSTSIAYTSDSHTAMIGAINKFINENVTAKSRFIYPFFTRYAIKLYDGSYSYISEPLLMIPNSGYVPAVSFSKHSSLGTRLIMSAFAADIRYKVRGTIPEDWEDLITGIDIFVSKPIWAYNQGQNYDGNTNYFRFRSSVDSVGYGQAYFDNVACDDNLYGLLELKNYINRYASNIITNNYIQVAPRSNEEIRKDVVSAANFYKISSLGLTELNNAVSDFVDIELDKEILSSLFTRETLKDDTLQYIGFKNAYIKEYNNRLHVCHSSVILRKPSHPKDCFNYISDTDGNRINAYVFLATDDGTKIIHTTQDSSLNSPWYFYPDSRAYKAAFYLEDITGNILAMSEIELKRHDYLNGAYWFSGKYSDALTFVEAADLPLSERDTDSIKALSMIYVSEVNCPFIFKAINAVNVGTQEVLAISTAAKALSQGQFGQFPLYAFTSEGVWALEVSSTGVYSARQPITRDVCINPQAVTQIDSAVLFPTKRGIMIISGSQTQCISDSINTEKPFNILKLKGMDKLINMLDLTDKTCFPVKAFSKFLETCGMIYDYVHQRIIVYNKDYSYAYVFSLKSKEWGMMYSQIQANVNSYPEALAIDKNYNLVDFTQNNNEDVKGLLVTRPLKLDIPDVHKTIDTIIQRGNFAKGHVQSVLYGSRDLINWYLVWSSKDHFMRGFRGTPYKYFRIACVTSLSEDESIYGASVQFTPRLTNQLR